MEMNKSLVLEFAKHVSEKCFEIKFWDDEVVKIGEGEPCFKVVINKFPSKKDLLAEPSLTLGEAYMNGDIDFEGNTQEILESIMMQKNSFLGKSKILKFLGKMKTPSKAQSKQDIAHHYDIGNNFYSLWLDKTMSYSCAYFKKSDDTLYDAQMNKIHHTIKKLNLKPGERLLDIGCGWGYLVIEAAKKYKVKCLGITLSEEQYTKGNERIKEAGLEDLVTIKLMDYRDLKNSGLEFDKIVSVGMAEHVGHNNLQLFFDNVNGVLKDGGLFLLHNITNVTESDGDKWITTYIFPGGYIPSLREEINIASDLNYHVIDVESLRMHYVKTLQAWVRNFEANIDKVEEMFDEKFIRMWRMYLNSSAAAFNTAGIDVHQTLYCKGRNNELPFTREYMYKD